MWNKIFIFIFKILVLWNQDFWEKFFQNISKISKICTRKAHFSSKFPNFLVTCMLSISLSRTLTHFNSLFRQVSQVSILSFENSHMFHFSLLTSLTHFNLSIGLHTTSFCQYNWPQICPTKNWCSQTRYIFCTKFQKHKHHKLQWGPIIERSNKLC
jgi:hypothetical protein